MKELGCCYLAPSGVRFESYIRAFFSHYRQFDAGIQHDLWILVKKVESSDIEATLDLCSSTANYIIVQDIGYDIGAFLQANRLLMNRYEKIAYIGTYARPIADKWLLKLYLAVSQAGIGLAGTFGSFEQGVSTQRPNPHIRTSGFILDPRLLESLSFLFPKSKADSLEFEHGDRSLSRRVCNAGLDCVVVDRNGTSYRQNEWNAFLGFRRNDQSGLMMRDNHTDYFDAASPEERRRLTEMTYQ